MKLLKKSERARRYRWFKQAEQRTPGAKEINGRVRQKMLEEQYSLMMSGWRP